MRSAGTGVAAGKRWKMVWPGSAAGADPAASAKGSAGETLVDEEFAVCAVGAVGVRVAGYRFEVEPARFRIERQARRQRGDAAHQVGGVLDDGERIDLGIAVRRSGRGAFDDGQARLDAGAAAAVGRWAAHGWRTGCAAPPRRCRACRARRSSRGCSWRPSRRPGARTGRARRRRT